MLKRMVVVLASMLSLPLAGGAEAGSFAKLNSQQNFSMSGGSDGASFYAGHGSQCDGLHPAHHCGKSQPGTTLPPCAGPHMGPNGVMIQCK